MTKWRYRHKEVKTDPPEIDLPEGCIPCESPKRIYKRDSEAWIVYWWEPITEGGESK